MRAIVRGSVSTCDELGLKVIAEGVETRAEFLSLTEMDIEVFQRYYFARPAFEAIPAVVWE